MLCHSEKLTGRGNLAFSIEFVYEIWSISENVRVTKWNFIPTRITLTISTALKHLFLSDAAVGQKRSFYIHS